MLNNIDPEKFAAKITETYNYDPNYSAKYAKKCIDYYDSALTDVVSAWIDGREVPNEKFGKYTFQNICEIQQTKDYLRLFELIDTYIKNPEKGDNLIWNRHCGIVF